MPYIDQADINQKSDYHDTLLTAFASVMPIASYALITSSIHVVILGARCDFATLMVIMYSEHLS
jgi:hypothetical protein